MVCGSPCGRKQMGPRYLEKQIHRAGCGGRAVREEEKGKLWLHFCPVFTFHRDSHLKHILYTEQIMSETEGADNLTGYEYVSREHHFRIILH